MKGTIVATMVPDKEPNYKGGFIPRVVMSTHPRFTVGTRFDWGFVKLALEDGYTVTITPFEEGYL